MTVPDDAPGKLLHLRLPSREPVPPDESDPEDHLPVKMPPRPGTALERIVVDAELVDEPPAPLPVPVDQPAGATVWTPPATDRRPILPLWVTDPATRRAAARWAAGHVKYVAGFQASRLPVYAARAYDPRSITRAVRRGMRWASDPETTERLAGVGKGDDKVYVQLRNDLRATRQARRMTLGGAVAGLVGVEAALGFVGPAWDQPALALAAVAALGIAGRRRDKPFVDHAVTHEDAAPRLSPDVVLLALAGLGIGLLAKADGVRFVSPPTRDGPGWRVDLDLPHGVTAGEVVDKREKLAANLRRPLGCVWPEGAKVHPGRLVLWVGDEDMATARMPPWPLLKAGRVNLFKPIPFGFDQRGRPVMLTLIYVAAVIGAVPRMGKTFAARLLMLAAALDPRTELHVYDLKGTGDFDALEPVAHRFRAGDDYDDLEYGLDDVKSLRQEMRRRVKVIRSLPEEVCPESKVTDELASVRSHGLHPVLLVVDECQMWFENKDHGAEFEEICGDLVRRGPAAGIIPVFSTQRPDAKSIPPVVSNNAVMRFCLKVTGHVANDMVLGGGMWTAGIRGSTFAFEDKGIGFLAGEGTLPRIVKTAKVDDRQAKQVVARARALRAAAGRITGHAAGETFDREQGRDFSLLADLLTVMGEKQAHSEVLCARLADQWPDRYAGWKPATLAAALDAVGVKTQRNTWAERLDGRMDNRAGVVRARLEEAVGDAGSRV